MKKTILMLILLTGISGFTGINAQQNEANAPLKIAEICKMVQLDSNQKSVLNNLYVSYKAAMDSAIFLIESPAAASKLIYHTKEVFNSKFMELLSDKQKAEYVRNTAAPEIAKKTDAKMKTLRKSGDYTELELEASYSEIYEYFMLEKIVYVSDKFNIDRQKENIAQLKKLEPQMLKTANSIQKAKHQGKTYQKGYQW